jgi:protein-S-isoprenylcysteine O-methyltransferase Ste14
LEFMTAFECNSVQGFLLSRPLMPDLMTGVLESEIRESSLARVRIENLSLPSITVLRSVP